MQHRSIIAWILGSIFFLYAFALRVSPSVMVDELMRDFGVSALVLGHLSAFYFYAYASIQIPVGVWMDRSGPRALMSVAAFTCAIGCMLFAFSPNIMVAYLGRLLIGLGCAFSWVGVLTIIGTLLPGRHFAAFTGGGQFAGTTGAILGQAPLGALIIAVGWRESMLWIGAFGLVLALGLWLVVPQRECTRPSNSSLLAGLRSAVSKPVTWLLSLIGMSLTGPVLAFAGLWGVPWFNAAYGLQRDAAASMISMVFIGWLCGAPALGWVSDRLGRRKPPLMFGTALSALATACVIYIPELATGAQRALLFTLGVGGSSMILCFAYAREHNAAFASGASLGVVNTFVVASGALFQPLIGWLLDLRWTGSVNDGVRQYSHEAFNDALVVLPVFALFGFCLTLFLRENRQA